MVGWILPRYFDYFNLHRGQTHKVQTYGTDLQTDTHIGQTDTHMGQTYRQTHIWDRHTDRQCLSDMAYRKQFLC